MSSTLLNRTRSFEATTQVVNASTDIVELYDGVDPNCEGLMVYNDSSAVLYVKFGTDASTSSFTFRLAPGGWYESPANAYVGPLSGVWAAANGQALITKLER